MSVQILTYTCDSASNRIFALVDDGSDNLQIYVGDASKFNENSTDPSLLSWSKYIRQPLGLKNDPTSKDRINISYANNTIFIKDPKYGVVTLLPEDLASQVKKINITTYHPVINEFLFQFYAFQVLKDGSFYYGTLGGAYYVDKINHVPPTLSTGDDTYPTVIKGNHEIIVIAISKERRGVFIARTIDKGKRQEWVRVGLEQEGDVYDIFIDESHFIVNLLTYFPDENTHDGQRGMVINRFIYDKFLSGGDPERLAPIEFGDNQPFDGASRQRIGSIQQPEPLDGITIGFIDTYTSTSKSKDLTLATNGEYKITNKTENPIELSTDYPGEELFQSTIMTPSNYYAFYLHTDGAFYIAPGGIKKAFKKINIEKII